MKQGEWGALWHEQPQLGVGNKVFLLFAPSYIFMGKLAILVVRIAVINIIGRSDLK
jgi:hypothetical protein